MLNYIWAGMLIFGIGYGCYNGRFQEIGDAILNSGGEAVTFSIGIIGVTAFWCGMLEILNQAGGIRFFARMLRRPILWLFPSSRSNPEAGRQIVTNLAANFFGLGNGATPSGIKSVKEMQKSDSPGRSTFTASPEICLFLVINAAAFQLLPTTILAIRAAAGSRSSFDVIVPIWIASAAALVTAVAVYYLCKLIPKRKAGRVK